MTQQRRFTKVFEEEAVRLALTSGQTEREIGGGGPRLAGGRRRSSRLGAVSSG